MVKVFIITVYDNKSMAQNTIYNTTIIVPTLYNANTSGVPSRLQYEDDGGVEAN